VLAPLVAKNENSSIAHTGVLPKGWLANDLHIPEISYEAIMSPNLSEQKFLNVKTNIIDTVLLEDSPGIIKIIDLPPVDTIQENSQKENLVTKILQRIFGNVFQHSKRGPDETFKVASEYLGHGQRAAELPGYNTNEVLLPHTDHAHYENPVRVQGFHAVQGVSENTFVHAFAALATLRQEDEDLYNALCESPMILGRVASFYNPPFAQATVDTAVRLAIGQSHVKRVRWHPHATGYLLSPFECYERARKAHCKFQEIIRRPSHSVTVLFRPGDLYVWDNFRILHGREKVIERPRLALGQTVIEQVVSDEHRAVRLDWLKDFIDYNWLVQTPSAQLDSLTQMIKAELRGRSI
jgi:alpha-ketoglutarate-dependent taurine dioxygenase